MMLGFNFAPHIFWYNKLLPAQTYAKPPASTKSIFSLKSGKNKFQFLFLPATVNSLIIFTTY
jgi:hypothetical protein